MVSNAPQATVPRTTPRQSKSAFHFTAGAVSGVSSAVLLQPFDLLKTRLQQSSHAHHSLRTLLTSIFTPPPSATHPHPSPLRQLWRGTAPSVLRTGVGSALYFGSLNLLRRECAHRNIGTVAAPSSSSALPKLTPSTNLLTGAIARAGAGFVLSPLTILKVRFESSLYGYTSLAGGVKEILGRDGVRGFFAGAGATALRDAPYAGLYVAFYEASKASMSRVLVRPSIAVRPETGDAKVSGGVAAGVNFGSGLLAAVAATGLTNPVDVLKTRVQVDPARYQNMVRCTGILLREEGWRSFFDGLGLRMARKALSSALAWTLYEELVRRAELHLEDGLA
ncbi:mitochondrial carrier [Eremomyces bilateralis CBS 781.70]|uniref:Mitochondrial glycine transporter n=1 Tax=Eremomyces bilateralis CBS 781.70 TaxID=1392243 RepID=A0A6G1FWV9_9PEZI|nr:mitochondrial carrier [Eremomyces bilateralis CBS 781.70]KAF1810327.1 mitochondrial carrier [Eremomyces bilateralis CBS 781.70]